MKLRLPFALLAAVVSAASYAEDVTHTLNADTNWKDNSTIISSQNATIQGTTGTAPKLEISGYNQQVFYNQSDVCGSTTWTLQNLGDVSVVSNNIAITDPNLASNLAAISQGVFRAFNRNGKGYNTLQIKDCGDLSFSNNTFSFANSTGNAAPILAYCEYQGGSDEYTVISIDGNNKKVIFDSNTITASRDSHVSICGGGIMVAIPKENGLINYNFPKIEIFGSDTLIFSNNAVSATSQSGTASASGGALYGGGYQIFDLSDNKNVQITGNSATATAKGNATAAGGGAYGNELRVDNVENLTISGNKVTTYSETGAANSSGSGCMVENLVLTNNDSLIVKDNVNTADGATKSYAYGAGLSSAFTTITGNEKVEISNNGAIAQQRTEGTSATAIGGGINSACVTLADNKNTTFRGNFLTSGDETKLAAITLVTFEGLEGYLDVSAAKDGSVIFYDPINVTDDNAEPVVNFNKATDGVEGSGEGTIIFSGEHTEKDLAAIIGRAPTADEIEASRTNSVACETKLHGGTMIVQNQAIFSTEKITAQADSNSTIEVKDAVLKAGTIAFDKSSELKTAGNATIEADSLTFADGSSMTMNGDGTTVKASAITFEKGSALTLNVDMNSTRIAAAAFRIDSDDATMDGTITMNLRFTRNLYAGSYKLLDAEDTLWTPDNVTIVGAQEGDGELVWEDGVLNFILSENLFVAHDPLADAVQAANWGVFRSSQAFVGALRSTRNNAVILDAPLTGGKSGLRQTTATGQTIAWGSVYSSYTHQKSSSSFSGADYSIYGAAIGIERQFKSGRSLGVAFGYDWGKASPRTTSRVDQNSWHAALYGCAGSWNVGKKGSLAIDWSASVGNTTSEQNELGADWSQDSMQLDARATYSYMLNARTALSAFAGIQYYAQGDDSTSRVKADSLQNLRLQAGTGISYSMTDRTTVYGELAIHNDTLRHNPAVEVDGFNNGSGANPGRLGGSVTIGAQYQLNSAWLLNASYHFEGTEDSGSHNANVGAVYSF